MKGMKKMPMAMMAKKEAKESYPKMATKGAKTKPVKMMKKGCK